ncbi:probable cyclic nucleotide-gated ion channel 20, chloroplastic isoform X3 [Magnolia sinica]|uniref:probable cyclic nucleotide-gated ion channel 20, chloroplastic isoform X3 n=1 Tax=Magnolia sinica TaxID=86752 RepID=UPI002657B081|nr:probable cyclic nucleotide-gated ion channel 20, chloroplastic isoform X3 [Magnolia sinica]
MAGDSDDEVPILLDTCSQLSNDSMEVPLKRFNTKRTTRSVSCGSMAARNSMGPYGSENSTLSYTSPLNGKKQALSMPMNGALSSHTKSGNFSQPMSGTLGGKTTAVKEFVIETGQTDIGWKSNSFVGKNEHLLKSGQLGRCNDPLCTTCPTNYDFKAAHKKYNKASASETKLHNALYGDAKGWAQKSFSSVKRCIPGIMNPHTKVVQQWNIFFVLSCLVALFVDPLFFFLLSVQKGNKCIQFNWSFANAIVIVRSFTDFIYLLHMLLQFRLAYFAPESRVVGVRDLVDHPKKIALHYLSGYFLLDIFVVLPLNQIMTWAVFPKYLGSSLVNYAENLIPAAVGLQYILKIMRFLPLIAGQSASGFIFKSALINVVINLLIFVVAPHVVGSFWYRLGVQRVSQCLRDVCSNGKIKDCKIFIDCGRDGENIQDFSLSHADAWMLWRTNENVNDCFVTDSGHFSYGIYQLVVLISTEQSIVTRYMYSLFWGFQQISTLAGNQVPSFFIGEVVFTMCIIGLGLFLFALVIGNMQTFLQSLGRRTLEMQLRCRDVEKWMSHRQLPEDLRRQVRLSEIFNWVAHRGVNEEALMENLPEDLQKDIRRHLFKFLKKVCIFTEMEDPILDAIYERLKQKLYIQGSKVLYQGAPIDKMVFIVRGKMESVRDGNPTPLLEGDVCGQELLTWCLEHSSVNGNGKKIRLSGQQLLSNRTVKCLTNVVAFVLRAEDLKEVATTFAPFLPSPRIRGHKVRIARLERRHSKLHSCSMEIQEASESGSEQQTST